MGDRNWGGPTSFSSLLPSKTTSLKSVCYHTCSWTSPTWRLACTLLRSASHAYVHTRADVINSGIVESTRSRAAYVPWHPFTMWFLELAARSRIIIMRFVRWFAKSIKGTNGLAYIRARFVIKTPYCFNFVVDTLAERDNEPVLYSRDKWGKRWIRGKSRGYNIYVRCNFYSVVRLELRL